MAPKSKSAKKSIGTPAQPQKEPTKPDWPPLKPLLPAVDLSVETLLENQILTIPRFWTNTLCKNYVSFLSTLPLTTTPGKPKKGEAVRVNDRFQINDPVFAEQLWSGTALKELVTNYTADGDHEGNELWGGDVIGLNPNIRIYRYSKGQFFDQHCEFLAINTARRQFSMWIPNGGTQTMKVTISLSPLQTLLRRYQPGRLGHYSCT